MVKKLSLFPLLIFHFILLNAQHDTDQPLYKRFPALPPLKLLLTDSTTVFTEKDLQKNKPTLVILFSPDCDHCKKETEDIIANIDRFKKLQIVMATMLDYNKMKTFCDDYSLKRFDNIIVGRDFQYLLPTFYKIKTLPFLAFYDKKGTLIDGFEGTMPVDAILQKFEQKP